VGMLLSIENWTIISLRDRLFRTRPSRGVGRTTQSGASIDPRSRSILLSRCCWSRMQN